MEVGYIPTYFFTLHCFQSIYNYYCDPSILGLLDQAHFRQVYGKEHITVDQNTNYYSDHDTLTVIIHR